MKKMSLMTMALAMVVMFMGDDAKAVNLPAGSEPTEEAMGNESDYSINMESSLMLQVNETFTLDPMVNRDHRQGSKRKEGKMHCYCQRGCS